MKIQKFDTYEQAMHFFNQELPMMPADIHAGEYGLERVKQFLEDLDSPQEKTPTIHIAGTSGKGTVAYLINAILVEHGRKTGLSLSPYVYDMRERWQVDSQFLDEDKILEFANRMIPAFEKAEVEKRMVSRFEAITILVFLIMSEQDLDYLVLETGMGGLLDATNVIETSKKVAVLTSIGFDHMHILGKTLPEIATQKAGIINEGSDVFAYNQTPEINQVFEDAIREKNAKLNQVEIEQYSSSNKQLQGEIQMKNISQAVEVCRFLSKRDDWEFDEALLFDALNKLYLPGRFEVVNNDEQTFIFDGAHNAQKIKALVAGLKSNFPDEKFGFLCVVAKQELSQSILNQLEPLAEEFVFVDYPEEIKSFKTAVDPHDATKLVTIESSALGYEEAVEHIQKSEIKTWVVTGSFYHLAHFKKLFSLE